MMLKMKCCNARDVIITDRGENRLCLYIQKKKVYERTDSKVISIGSLDIRKLSRLTV